MPTAKQLRQRHMTVMCNIWSKLRRNWGGGCDFLMGNVRLECAPLDPVRFATRSALSTNLLHIFLPLNAVASEANLSPRQTRRIVVSTTTRRRLRNIRSETETRIVVGKPYWCGDRRHNIALTLRLIHVSTAWHNMTHAIDMRNCQNTFNTTHQSSPWFHRHPTELFTTSFQHACNETVFQTVSHRILTAISASGVDTCLGHSRRARTQPYTHNVNSNIGDKNETHNKEANDHLTQHTNTTTQPNTINMFRPASG